MSYLFRIAGWSPEQCFPYFQMYIVYLKQKKFIDFNMIGSLDFKTQRDDLVNPVAKDILPGARGEKGRQDATQ